MRQIFDGVRARIFLKQCSATALQHVCTSLKDDLASVVACVGTNINQIIRRPHDFFIMFYDHNGVAQFLKVFQHAYQPVGVSAVKSDARLVEDI